MAVPSRHRRVLIALSHRAFVATLAMRGFILAANPRRPTLLNIRPGGSEQRTAIVTDVEWIRKRWGGKLVLKGILDVEDARIAAGTGADAIIVSNHGGRQLDGAMASIEAVPAIADAVGKQIEVWMDGGIRSGQDVLKAIALGAKATMIGRAFLYGLGAMGEAGVTKCLEIIQRELDLTMAFCGRTDIRAVDRSILL